MDYLSIAVIALGLSMDAFAVSMSNGCTMGRLKKRTALKMALFFGGFQALMPIIGWLAGSTVQRWIGGFDHWIAFGLLTVIGGKMIWESGLFGKSEEKMDKQPDVQSLLVLFGLAIATSIDALAVGFTFSLLKANIFISAGIIGMVTFILSYLGVVFGCKVGSLLEKKVEIAGGLVLIGIGLKILIEHLVFN